jgi:tRNA (adenine22-N1)-methyltransferase
MVTTGNIMADIGTDHGYVPIYLVKNNICPKAFAFDINEGPLKIAGHNVLLNGVADKITLIKSDGMNRMEDYMAQTVVIAGMGGDLIIDILNRGRRIKGINELILSPHKRVDLVRTYLLSNGWKISDENMIKDAGKYYTIIKAVSGKSNSADYTKTQIMYGKILLENKNEILREYLEKEYNKFSDILCNMKTCNNEKYKEIEDIINLNRKAEAYFD